MSKWDEFRNNLDNRVAEIENRKKQANLLIGKFFQFKEQFDDEDYTYLRVIRVEHSMVIADRFSHHKTGYGIKDLVIIDRFFPALVEDYHKMTELTADEFYYQVNQMLSKIGLQLKDDLKK